MPKGGKVIEMYKLSSQAPVSLPVCPQQSAMAGATNLTTDKKKEQYLFAIFTHLLNNQNFMATAQQIQEGYIDYVLTNNEPPKSVYVFAKSLGITEQEFYLFYSSFLAIEKAIWTDLTLKTISEIEQQEVWPNYSAREKVLAFFYAYIELLKSQRSFVVYSLNKHAARLQTPEVLTGVKNVFDNFADASIREGLDKGELADRKFFSKRYKDALWVQFGVILNFWINDNSTGFEKTDEAIERGINVTFDLFQRSTLDNLIDYGKFFARNNKGFKEAMRF